MNGNVCVRESVCERLWFMTCMSVSECAKPEHAAAHENVGVCSRVCVCVGIGATADLIMMTYAVFSFPQFNLLQ